MKKPLKMNMLFFVFLIFYFNYVLSESDNCNFGTCGECISFARDNDNCVWCAQEPFKGRRCQPLSSLDTTTLNTTNSWCKDGFLINPQSFINVTQDQDFGGTVDDVTVQFKPQVIKMKARPGVPISFNMSYKPAKHFPLDVYYLMDVTYTMEPKMGDLKAQAMKIYTELTSYTNNVRLGVGSFVEKPGFPFVDVNKHKSHAFKNLVSLTNDMKRFTSMIDKVETGSNFDDPEAGLDALMQVMTCENEIGWRKGARRIIVLCTDSTYHSAGDGKIVGAIKPHDMKCHLTDNMYTMALVYDYPSVSQINKVASDGNFKIIFAITKNTDSGHTPDFEYKALVQQILGAKYAKLEDKTGVVNIIKEAYNEAARSVQLNFNPPDFIQLTTDCNSTSASAMSTKNCGSTHVEPVVTIPGTLIIKSCPTDGIMEREFTVIPVGLEDKLTIKLEIDCKCNCEKEVRVSSSKCNNAGAIQCGICNCDPGRYGVDCRCNGTSTDLKDMEKCKLNVDDSRLCSGRGKCRCGKCEQCPPGFSGDFCEFNDNSCPRPNNKLCSGKGVCKREQCECDAHWTGKDCSCPDDQSACFAPYSHEVCSGNGVCNCGVCICNALDSKNETYSGAFCDNCEECAEKRCKELEDYAYCNHENMDNKQFCDQQNNDTTTDIGVTFLNKTEINGPDYYMAKWCKKELDSHNGTYMVFKYQYDEQHLKLAIQKELEQPPEANLWIAAGSALGLVLLIGILTVIIWKILVDMHDKREYRKFKGEAEAAGYDVSLNPLYQDPAINFENPVYNNSCN